MRIFSEWFCCISQQLWQPTAVFKEYTTTTGSSGIFARNNTWPEQWCHLHFWEESLIRRSFDSHDGNRPALIRQDNRRSDTISQENLELVVRPTYPAYIISLTTILSHVPLIQFVSGSCPVSGRSAAQPNDRPWAGSDYLFAHDYLIFIFSQTPSLIGTIDQFKRDCFSIRDTLVLPATTSQDRNFGSSVSVILCIVLIHVQYIYLFIDTYLACWTFFPSLGLGH